MRPPGTGESIIDLAHKRTINATRMLTYAAALLLWGNQAGA